MTRRVFYGWWIVVAATIGMSLSPGTLAFYSLGLFIKPLNAAYGWDRAEVSLVATILTVGIMLAMPVVGWLVDRYGPRRVVMPSLLLLAIGLASLALVRTLWQFYLAFAFIGVFGAGANSLAYMRLLATWFDRRRGLVIGIASAGMGLGVMLIPPFVHAVMLVGGVQAAYAGLALVVVCIGIPVMAFVVRDAPEEIGLRPDGASSAPADAAPSTAIGYPMDVVLRKRQFWLLLVIFMAIAGAVNSVAVHMVAMLQDRGSGVETAVMAASLFGGAMLFGRLATGYLIDRFFAPYVAALFFLSSTAALAALSMGAAGPLALVASVLIGLCAGAEGDVLGYLISRYFGLRSFGKIYGYTLSVYMIGVSIFPYAMGVGYETTGSYTGMLFVCTMLNLASAMMLLLLGPYPDLDSEPVASP